MRNKKTIIAFLIILSAFYTANRVGNVISVDYGKLIDLKQKVSIAHHSLPSANEAIFEIVGIMHPSINANENNNPTFQHLKNYKKAFYFSSPIQSLHFSNTDYEFYCSRRINQIKISALHIVYHKLLI